MTLHVIKIQEVTQIAVLATASTEVLQEDHQDSKIPKYMNMSVSRSPIQYKRVFGMTGLTFAISSNITFSIDQIYFERKLVPK